MSFYSFADRHIGPSKEDVAVMLQAIGVPSVKKLMDEIIPPAIKQNEDVYVPQATDEHAFLRELRKTAAKNKIFRSYIGLGYYNCIIPPVIQRNIFENPGWYTAYTPYQAEIAQGRMEALLNFQTMVSDLTELPLANASLLDESTAAAEAMMLMFHSRTREMEKKGVVKFFVADDCYPQTIDVLKTRSAPLGIELVTGNAKTFAPLNDYFGMLLQYPSCYGEVIDYRDLVKKAHEKNVKTGVAADLMSLVHLSPPGEWGADVAVGSTQRFGVPLGYGGPHAAFFATREEFKRDIPGRIIGLSVDAAGKPALRMALQTREQHIKREKATSNICTAQVLLAVMASMYAVYHGPEGIKAIATSIHKKTSRLAAALRKIGFTIVHENFFDTIKINTAGETGNIRKAAEAAQINFLYNKDGSVCISMDETATEQDVEDIISVFASVKGDHYKKNGNLTPGSHSLPTGRQVKEGEEIPVDFFLKRKSNFLTHPVFNKHHSETEMLRYIKRLENKDLALNHSMIPLGSCTMKLNATTEMMPLSWPLFSQIHPFVPHDQAQGYLQIISELEEYLCRITGFAAVSLQPNSGAQGEYAGLMVIRAWHESRGEKHRDVVLIPQSAHGTNPASAVMAGYKVVVVNCDEKGNIELNDLSKKAAQHKNNLAALMVTYPSTHGVYEEGIKEITSVIHENGGQVYMDGANMNAQVGLTNPAMIGADVCHLNLHKTFAIPHGGGGPGMGPIGVAAHLAPFLPGHPLIKAGGEKAIHAISAAPFGSASILIISYAYIRLLGKTGVKASTEAAILNANYLRRRLEKYYPVLYTGRNGHVAHEMILDCRQFKQSAGIEVVDIAKRLMDYGFHAPTVSFPVAGTLMVEPTESEPLEELDRFCEAMICIRKEIEAIEKGEASREDNVLVNSPHTAFEIASDAWNHSYSRQQAVFPAPWVAENKFFPSVKRVDNAYGDRNLVCTCPPMENYLEEVAEE